VTHEELEEAISLYAVDALDHQERQALESHLLTGCATCHAVLKDYYAVAKLLPYGLPPVPVPEALKQRVMAAAFRSGPLPTETPTAIQTPDGVWTRLGQFIFPIRPFQSALTLALVVLIVGTGFCSMLYAWWAHSQMMGETEQRRQAETVLQEALSRTAALQQQATQQVQAITLMQQEFGKRADQLSDVHNRLIQREVELDQLRTQLAQVEKETTGLRRTLAQRDEMLTLLRSAHVKVVSLSGLESAKSAGAFLLYDRETKTAFFYAFNMPSLPPGKTYQLWAIVDKPMSAGVFGTDDGHKGRLLIRSLPDFSRITKFAVSLEPEGGRSQPTGDLYLAGKI
jgi:anti-sigma-K factor RskA